MSGQRIPKHNHPENMCFQCQAWVNTALDYGECMYPNICDDFIDQGDHYAYEEACFLFWPHNKYHELYPGKDITR